MALRREVFVDLNGGIGETLREYWEEGVEVLDQVGIPSGGTGNLPAFWCPHSTKGHCGDCMWTNIESSIEGKRDIGYATEEVGPGGDPWLGENQGNTE